MITKHENASVLGSKLRVHHCSIGKLIEVWAYVISMPNKKSLIGSANSSVNSVRPEESLGRVHDVGSVRKPSCKKANNAEIEVWCNGHGQT